MATIPHSFGVRSVFLYRFSILKIYTLASFYSQLGISKPLCMIPKTPEVPSLLVSLSSTLSHDLPELSPQDRSCRLFLIASNSIDFYYVLLGAFIRSNRNFIWVQLGIEKHLPIPQCCASLTKGRHCLQWVLMGLMVENLLIVGICLLTKHVPKYSGMY